MTQADQIFRAYSYGNITFEEMKDQLEAIQIARETGCA